MPRFENRSRPSYQFPIDFKTQFFIQWLRLINLHWKHEHTTNLSDKSLRRQQHFVVLVNDNTRLGKNTLRHLAPLSHYTIKRLPRLLGARRNKTQHSEFLFTSAQTRYTTGYDVLNDEDGKKNSSTSTYNTNFWSSKDDQWVLQTYMRRNMRQGQISINFSTVHLSHVKRIGTRYQTKWTYLSTST